MQTICHKLTVKTLLSFPPFNAHLVTCFLMAGVVSLIAVLWSAEYRAVGAKPIFVTQLASIRDITGVVASGIIFRDTHYGAVSTIPVLMTNLRSVYCPAIIMSLRVIP